MIMINLFKYFLFFDLKTLLIFNLLFLLNISFPVFSYSQTDSAKVVGKIKPVTPLSKFIKFSNVTAKNNLNYDGKVNGFLNGNSNFIKDFNSQEIFSFETANYDSIQFYFDLPNSYVDKFFIQVTDNIPFEFDVKPFMELSGADIFVANNQLKNLFTKDGMGKKLYDISITDDVNPDQIKVEATPIASKYIEVVKLDSSTYQVKLKSKKEFYGNLSEEIKEKWSKGEEIKFPIGVNLFDTVITTDNVTIQYNLVKKKKPKKA